MPEFDVSEPEFDVSEVEHPRADEELGWFSYTCGHCNTRICGAVVADYFDHRIKWLLCPKCCGPSVLTVDGDMYPGALGGPNIQGLRAEVDAAYGEARRCMSVNSFIACELVCRKILMHAAVDKGAKEGETFADYIDYLEKKGYITPPMEKWVQLIRQHGNQATHSIEPADKERAEGTLIFTAQLLRLVYEMEHLSDKYAPPEGD